MGKRQLRKLGMEEVQAGIESTFDLPVIHEGTLADLHRFCKERGYVWRPDGSVYGGYYVDQVMDAYLLT